MRQSEERLALAMKATQEALWWRLNGPCGAKAVEDAILKEARGVAEEECFFLAEICLELITIKPWEHENAAGYMKGKQVRRELLEYAKRIAERLANRVGELEGGMRNYVEKAIEKVEQE